MQEELCELRFDIPLAPAAFTDPDGPRLFERGWRDVLAAQRLAALAMPPAEAVRARFRLCPGSDFTAGPSALERYLPARLAALPGAPAVAADPAATSPDWHGVRIWLSYRAHDLTTLLQRSKKTSRPRGRRR